MQCAKKDHVHQCISFTKIQYRDSDHTYIVYPKDGSYPLYIPLSVNDIEIWPDKIEVCPHDI